MQTFPIGYRLIDEDLSITFQRKASFSYGPLSSYNPFSIMYEIGTLDGNMTYTRKGPENRIPYNIKIGMYRANFLVNNDWDIGLYRIIWKYQICMSDPITTSSEEFEITV